MVNVNEINEIIDRLKEDAENIHEIRNLCNKIAELGEIAESQQSEINTCYEKLENLSAELSSMKEQYTAALNSLSLAGETLKTTASELKISNKKLENDNNERFEDFRNRVSSQLQASDDAVSKKLDNLQKNEESTLNQISEKTLAAISPVANELKTVKTISILGAVCALVAAILSAVL